MKKESEALKYWENKILNWETFRYSKWLLLYPFSWTVRIRLNSASKIILTRSTPEWSVLELGCGSGYLASKIIDSVSSYFGVDIAANAIELARTKFKGKKGDFVATDVIHFEFTKKADVVIFLGLTDWLGKEALEAMISRISSNNIFFSYTESRVVSFLNPYFYYRKLMDRKSKKNSYIARTYSENEIKSILQQAGFSFELVKKASLFDPGALVWGKR